MIHLAIKLTARELRKQFGRGGNNDSPFGVIPRQVSGMLTYQFQIIKSGINKIVYQSKRYNDVEMMEEVSVKKASRYDDQHYYCIQYKSGSEIDYQLTEWIYEQKVNCKEDDESQQNMCDDMCSYENDAGAEVFPC